nr:PepSY domain-containing protein [uncultured Desulfobacter sp.]
MKKKAASGIFLTVAVLSALGISQVFAGERPPADSKPIVEIIQTLETQGYAPITEISMDDGLWEVEAYKNNEERELRVNPLTGEILSDRRDN